MLRVVFALAMAAATPVAAQERAPSEIALDLIAGAQAQGLFELVDGEGVALRHTRSGLICRFDSAHDNRLLVFTTLARGEDVACDAAGQAQNITLYATRYSRPAPLAAQIESAQAAVLRRYPDARQLATAAAAGDAAQGATTRFIYTTPEGQPTYSRITIAVVRGWSVKLRYNASAADDAARQAADRAADALWRQVLADVNAATR